MLWLQNFEEFCNYAGVNKKQLLKSCLSDWDCKNYPDAKKERQKKLEDLEECINILKLVQENKLNLQDFN